MKKFLLSLLAVAVFAGSALHAQEITGTWQGTLQAGKDLRIILKVSRDDNHLQATMYSIDQKVPPFKAASASFAGGTLKFAVDMIGASYEGKLSADGKSIAGNWTQGPNPLPLNFTLATKETAWEIPAPPPPPPLMAADSDPSFDVATIKPNNSGLASMQQLSFNGHDFKVVNGSLTDLISFAYGVQSKQLVGAPAWLDIDRFDIAAVPDQQGMPSSAQLKTMLRKLIVDRCKLTFHHDKRDLSAFVLSVAKDGPRMTPTQSKSSGPGFGFRPKPGGLTIPVGNASMEDFTGFLQTLVLDRPVVDQTALTGRFDFSLTFTPDETQFNGHPPAMAKQGDNVETAPSLFDAIQQQLGLKLEAKKTAVDVLVIDHVEKPSAN